VGFDWERGDFLPLRQPHPPLTGQNNGQNNGHGISVVPNKMGKMGKIMGRVGKIMGRMGTARMGSPVRGLRFLQRAQLTPTQRQSETCTALDWPDPDPGRAWWAANGMNGAQMRGSGSPVNRSQRNRDFSALLFSSLTFGHFY
jgi:hypothetical protein